MESPSYPPQEAEAAAAARRAAVAAAAAGTETRAITRARSRARGASYHAACEPLQCLNCRCRSEAPVLAVSPAACTDELWICLPTPCRRKLTDFPTDFASALASGTIGAGAIATWVKLEKVRG